MKIQVKKADIKKAIKKLLHILTPGMVKIAKVFFKQLVKQLLDEITDNLSL